MAPLVAQCIMTAVERYHFGEEMDRPQQELYHWLMDLYRGTDTLYSYRNTLIAVLDDDLNTAGCLISYPGEDYAGGVARSLAGREGLGRSELETGPGEYYLDTLALTPEARGYRIGHQLLQRAIDHATKELGYDLVSLLVDVDKPRLQAYYGELGFVRERKMQFMGDDYFRMTLTTK